MNTYEQRYLELQEDIQKAIDKRSKARESKNIELTRDADSRLDFCYGQMSELKKWFGNHIKLGMS